LERNKRERRPNRRETVKPQQHQQQALRSQETLLLIVKAVKLIYNSTSGPDISPEKGGEKEG
jgi:hypothetical protein